MHLGIVMLITHCNDDGDVTDSVGTMTIAMDSNIQVQT